jgi:UDP-N-acetylglucosamine--N-acetylmuramyl-(pentapeptide) pyrophosphoryl-undecaprenol N-acetylglucosamine transferase
MRLFRPHVVLVTGAYISYPAGVAAKQLGLPLVVMESNVNLGKSNRQLANAATLIALSFEESLQHLPPHLHHKARVTGNPVRLNIQPGISSGEARSAFGLHQGEPTVLVMGGSLGARSINNAVQRMVEAWSAEAKAPYQLIWQTGRQFVARVPDELKGAVVTQEFIANVGMAYAAASLVVCRSGATTVAELGVMGKPAILVPLPSASTDEQRRNAEAVALRNAAMLLPDAELGALLPSRIHELLSDPPRLEEMARCMQELARPKAADVVAAEIESIWRRA